MREFLETDYLLYLSTDQQTTIKAFRTLFKSPIVKFMNGCLKVFTVYVLKQSGIDDTIEIRIIIFVEIFQLIKKHCEKKKCQKSSVSRFK